MIVEHLLFKVLHLLHYYFQTPKYGVTCEKSSHNIVFLFVSFFSTDPSKTVHALLFRGERNERGCQAHGDPGPDLHRQYGIR